MLLLPLVITHTHTHPHTHTHAHTHTHTHTPTHARMHTYTYRCLHRNDFKKPGACLVLKCYYNNNGLHVIGLPKVTAFIWQLKLLWVVAMSLGLKSIIGTNLIRVSYCCISYYCSIPFKLLYTGKKTVHFSYKGGGHVHGNMQAHRN